MGAAAGAALKGMDGYQMAAKRTVYAADELSQIETVTAVSVPGSPAGRTAGDVK